MSTRTITILIVSGLVGLGALFFLLTSQNQDSSTQNNSQETVVLENYSINQIESHNSSDDCWTVIDGFVYDITSYVPRHPGGDEILKACGEDSTTLFNSRTDEDGDSIGSGTPHSSSAKLQLERLKIGTLGQ